MRTQAIIESVNVKIDSIDDFSYPQELDIHNLGKDIEDDRNIQENCVMNLGSNSPIKLRLTT